METTDSGQADQAPWKSERALRLVADNALACISYLDADQRYRFVNKRYTDWFGLLPEEIVGKHIREVLGDEVYELIGGWVEAALAGRQVSYERRLPYCRGGPRWVMVTLVPDVSEEGRVGGCWALVHDITEHKRAEDALREREAWLRAIVQTAVDGIITTDDRGVIQSFNSAAEQIFGYAAAEAIGKSISILMACPCGGDRDDCPSHDASTGMRQMIGRGRELVGRRQHGTRFPMEVAVSEFCLGERRMFTAIARDISDRKRLEMEMLDISARERRQIGHDLHDGVGQALTGIAFLGKVLEQNLAAKGIPEADQAAEMTTLVNQVIAMIRDMSRLLCPVNLEADGLVRGLEQLASTMQKLFNVSCVFRCETLVPIHDNAVATHLYHIAQEALTNAIRHGKPRHVVVSLRAAKRSVTLTVENDGVDFPEVVEPGLGMGLRIMHYRARIIDAALTIRPSPAGGTVLTCRFPHGDGLA